MCQYSVESHGDPQKFVGARDDACCTPPQTRSATLESCRSETWGTSDHVWVEIVLGTNLVYMYGFHVSALLIAI